MPIGLLYTTTSWIGLYIAVHWFISANWNWKLRISNGNQIFDELIMGLTNNYEITIYIKANHGNVAQPKREEI